MRGWMLIAIGAIVTAAPGSYSAAASATPLRRSIEPPRRPVWRGPRASALPVVFEANRGQTREDVSFLARCRTYHAWFSGTQVTLAGATTERGDRDVLSLRFAGSREAATPRGDGALESRSNYFVGDDPSGWVVGAENFAGLRVANAYRGIDVRWRSEPDGSLAFDLVAERGADASAIRCELDGVESIRPGPDGGLVLQMRNGAFHMSAPRLFQERDGVRSPVSGGFQLGDDGRIGFRVGEYDVTRELVIDPTISYSSFLGGSAADRVRGIDTDATGAIYLLGSTSSSDFPTQSPYQSAHGSTGSADAFVAKLNASGSALAFSTFFGGSGTDRPTGLGIDASGNVLFAGNTTSTNLPTASAVQSSHAGGTWDCFVAKLTSNGSALAFSTYHGGSGLDYFGDYFYGKALAVDGSGAAYIAGWTHSTDFPTTSSAVQASKASSSTYADLFVAKFTGSGSLSYSTYYGGTGDQAYCQMAVDSSGAAYVVASNTQGGFPTTSGVYQSSNAGGSDVALVKLNATGSAVVYSGYLGGSGTDVPRAVTVDSSGSAIIVGTTESSDFPTTSGAFQTSHGGGTTDVFVARLSANGSSLSFGTYLGGGGEDTASGVTVDGDGNPVIVGSTDSDDFPTASPIPGGGSRAGDQDAFVTRLSAAGTSALFSTYLGGSDKETGYAVAVDASQRILVGGNSQSSDFPLSNAYQSTLASGGDGFITRVGPAVAPEAPEELAAHAVSDSAVAIEWSAADLLATSFGLQRAIGAGAFSDLATLSADTESYSDETVGGGTTYRYRIRAVNDIGASDWSSTATATTPSAPPSSVGGSSPTNRSITITWDDDADDETGYIVERALGCPGVTWTVIATLRPDSTSYTDTTVQPETEYSYRVRTLGSEASSSPSLEVCVTTGPANPTSLLAITQSDTSVLLRWSDNSAIEMAYEIERTPTGGVAAVIGSVPGNTAEHVDATVSAETEYRYRVRAVTDEGASSWSPAATTRTAPAAPTEPFGEAVSSSRLRLTWTDNSPVEQGFEVRRRIHGQDVPLDLVARLPANTTSFVDAGLLQETAYDYTIHAYDGSGDSNPVAVDELKTTAVLVIGKIKTKAAKGKKPASMKIQAAIDFGGYESQPEDGATIRIGEHVFVLGELVAKGKGLNGKADGVSFKLSPVPPASSRGKLKMTITGAAADVGLNDELTIAFATGDFLTAGTLQLAGGSFDLKKGRGVRIDPDMIPTQLKLTLGGIEKDRLALSMSFEPRPAPGEIPNALVTVGDVRLIFPGLSAVKTKDDTVVTYALTGVPEAKLTVDYAKGTLKLTKTKALELGEYPAGDVPTLLDVTIGDLRWRDVPVLRHNGHSVTY